MSRTPRFGDDDAIALHAASVDGEIALSAGQRLPDNAADGGAPEWLQLLPAGPTIPTVDGRGPYRVGDLAALAAASMAGGERLPIDENHATDLAGPNGRPSPARGWIVELKEIAGALHGRVEWTPAGKQLMAERSYRYVSPVFMHTKDGTVTRVLRAALVNTPNLRGMPALHRQETTMNPTLAALLKALGLANDADEATALQAIETLKTTASTTALQSALSPIATAAGLAGDADGKAILAAVTTLATGAGAEKDRQLVALQAELTSVATELKTLKETGARTAATAFVDGAIKEGRVGVKPLRDHYIAQHMIDPARVEKEIGAMAALGPSGARLDPPTDVKDKDGKVIIALNAEQRQAAKVLGIAEDKYAATLAAERQATAA